MDSRPVRPESQVRVPGCSREQEHGGQVRARDQKDKRDRAEKDNKSGPHAEPTTWSCKPYRATHQTYRRHHNCPCRGGYQFVTMRIELGLGHRTE